MFWKRESLTCPTCRSYHVWQHWHDSRCQISMWPEVLNFLVGYWTLGPRHFGSKILPDHIWTVLHSYHSFLWAWVLTVTGRQTASTWKNDKHQYMSKFSDGWYPSSNRCSSRSVTLRCPTDLTQDQLMPSTVHLVDHKVYRHWGQDSSIARLSGQFGSIAKVSDRWTFR